MKNRRGPFTAVAQPAGGSSYTLSTFPRVASLRASTQISRVRLHCWLSAQGKMEEAKRVSDSRAMVLSLNKVDLEFLGFAAA